MRHKNKKMLVLLVGLPMVALSLGSCGDGVAGPEPIQNPPEPVEAAIESFRGANPGVLSAIGLIQRQNGDTRRGSSGFLDASRATEISPETKFGIGSTTKTFTATMVLQLMEEGRVELDHPIVDYLGPSWALVLDSLTFGPEITVRQALSHRSGTYDYLVSQLQAELLSEPGRVYTPLEAFQYAKSGPPAFPPGTDFQYSNTNFLMLGNLVENITGHSYVEELETRILNPVGMPNTFVYHSSTASQRAGIAHSYATIGGSRFDILDFSMSGWARAVGGIISSATDLTAFLTALGSGHLFANAETLEAMTDLGENTWYGLGLQIDDQPSVGRCFGHGGYAFGSTTHVRHCPDTGVTFSAFYASDGSALGAHLDIVERMLASVF